MPWEEEEITELPPRLFAVASDKRAAFVEGSGNDETESALLLTDFTDSSRNWQSYP